MANNKFIYRYIVQHKLRMSGYDTKATAWTDKKSFASKALADRYESVHQARMKRRWGKRAGKFRVVLRRKPNPRYRDDASIEFYGTPPERAQLMRKLRRKGPYRY